MALQWWSATTKPSNQPKAPSGPSTRSLYSNLYEGRASLKTQSLLWSSQRGMFSQLLEVCLTPNTLDAEHRISGSGFWHLHPERLTHYGKPNQDPFISHVICSHTTDYVIWAQTWINSQYISFIVNNNSFLLVF